MDDASPLGNLQNLVWLRLPTDADPAAAWVSWPEILHTSLVGNVGAGQSDPWSARSCETRIPIHGSDTELIAKSSEMTYGSTTM